MSVRVLDRWAGFCPACREEERPLVLTVNGPTGVRAWLDGVQWHDRELTLTCTICGHLQQVPWDESDDVDQGDSWRSLDLHVEPTSDPLSLAEAVAGSTDAVLADQVVDAVADQTAAAGPTEDSTEDQSVAEAPVADATVAEAPAAELPAAELPAADALAAANVAATGDEADASSEVAGSVSDGYQPPAAERIAAARAAAEAREAAKVRTPDQEHDVEAAEADPSTDAQVTAGRRSTDLLPGADVRPQTAAVSRPTAAERIAAARAAVAARDSAKTGPAGPPAQSGSSATDDGHVHLELAS